ncbi:hypothetical protein SPSIL_052440 [Sporomusa silvacetica DSM 10669]|uniref:Tetratricopeptide repeat protein n=1 Tax=Sporomusa silvacetica DSM 10669 TaxID=1123289 RepID=A0ABZ3ITZ8_9FIRM|nr:hypothetical protein [Sporomusa silvacetica]OZC19665.1 hypothetical protein SPSIL_20950 [Sporomusa silvacetica DSM 10669]
MNSSEFEAWIEYVIEKYSMPRLLFKKGIDDWKARVFLGRALSRKSINKLEPAMDLYYSIVDIEVIEPEDIEDKAWVLWELGLCIWHIEEDANKAIKYIDISIQLAESISDKFSFIERGEVWYDRWWLLHHIDQTDRAMLEANQKISERDAELKNNSYLYYAYRFKAELSYEQGDIDQALAFLYQALTYFPDDHNTMANLQQLWEKRNNDKEKTYKKMDELTQHPHVCWEI